MSNLLNKSENIFWKHERRWTGIKLHGWELTKTDWMRTTSAEALFFSEGSGGESGLQIGEH